jgi:hypothetical protein
MLAPKDLKGVVLGDFHYSRTTNFDFPLQRMFFIYILPRKACKIHGIYKFVYDGRVPSKQNGNYTAGH